MLALASRPSSPRLLITGATEAPPSRRQKGQTDALDCLARQGHAVGYLTFSQIADHLPDDSGSEEVGPLLVLLEREGIDLISDDRVAERRACLGCKRSKAPDALSLEYTFRGKRRRPPRTVRLQITHCRTCRKEPQSCPACQESRPVIKFYRWISVDYVPSRYCSICRVRAWRAQEKYDVPAYRFLETLESQGGVCAICSRGPAADLVVDHCHAREKFRALLCRSCNAGLGQFQDEPHLLRAAAEIS
jgi:hypothetical protein